MNEGQLGCDLKSPEPQLPGTGYRAEAISFSAAKSKPVCVWVGVGCVWVGWGVCGVGVCVGLGCVCCFGKQGSSHAP